MSEEQIVTHCSPTLAGMKTGSIFNCAYKTREEMCRAVRLWNHTLSDRGIRVLPLRYNGTNALIYIFRPSRLCFDLNNETAVRILNGCGYSTENADYCVARLAKRLNGHSDFPHEIGLFLGYPPEDVLGFIENRAGGCKYTGCWKVYGDVDSAVKTFAKYKKCTDVYRKKLSDGRPIKKLTVAI